jgi:hypothetical protein
MLGNSLLFWLGLSWPNLSMIMFPINYTSFRNHDIWLRSCDLYALMISHTVKSDNAKMGACHTSTVRRLNSWMKDNNCVSISGSHSL